MKVLMIAPQPFFQPRGTPISVLHRLNTLSKLGNNIDLVTYHLGETIPIKNVNYYRILTIPFVKKISIGPSTTKLFLDVFLFFKTLKMLIVNRYDVIHSHEEAGFLAIWLAKLFGVKHLYDMHSSLPQQLTNFKFSKFKPLINVFEFLEKRTIANSDAVITICPELYNYVKMHYPAKQLVLIENVADNSMIFQTNRIQLPDLRSKYQIGNRTIILYSGTLEPYQGIDLLLESAKIVLNRQQGVIFMVVGGHPEQIDTYKGMAQRLGIAQSFIFTGQVKPDEVKYYLDIADILVTPRVEGNNTPLKIYEYLRSGKPVIATNHITHTQVLNNRVSILTDINANAFADGIMRVLTDDQLKQTIVSNALKLSEEKYSYDAYVKKTETIYRVLSNGTYQGTEQS